MSDLTCQSCRHFVVAPPDPNNLAAPRAAQCRWGPPHLTLLPSQQGVMQICDYPAVQTNSPACHQHSAPTAPAEGDSLDWWDRTVRELLEARRQGNDFVCDVLRQDLARYLQTAGPTEREALVESLVGMYVLLDGAVPHAEPARTH